MVKPSIVRAGEEADREHDHDAGAGAVRRTVDEEADSGRLKDEPGDGRPLPRVPAIGYDIHQGRTKRQTEPRERGKDRCEAGVSTARLLHPRPPKDPDRQHGAEQRPREKRGKDDLPVAKAGT